jgi:alpha-tubulin suppressor-like RCC1 family protein
VRKVGGEKSAGLHRLGAALKTAAVTATLLFAITPSAQAHVPYLPRAWGYDGSGQLGDGTEFGPEECLPAAQPCSTKALGVTALSGVAAMSGGEEHSLALLSDGTVRAWGSNEYGQLGDGSSGDVQPESTVPVGVYGLCCATSVAAGARHSLALENDATVRAWGENELGQLGNGSAGLNHGSDVPVVVTEWGGAALTGVSAIAAGEEHSLALKEGKVMAWGSNLSGQLGIGTSYSNRVHPSVVMRDRTHGVELSGVAAIAAGAEHSLALLSNHAVVAWGANNVGQLGNITAAAQQQCAFGACSTKPVPVEGLGGEVVAIAAGGNHSLALLANGTVMAWGENTLGQLGNGTTSNSAVPVAVSGLSGVAAVAAGEEHSLALLSDGTVRAWGANGEGELGDGTSSGPEKCGPPGREEACSPNPVGVSGLSDINITGIAAGGWHSLAFGPPFPTVTSVSPSGGLPLGGTLVTVTGTEFEAATAVKFGSANAIIYKVESPTSITAVSPKGEGTVDVTVTTPEGTSHITPTDRFSYGLPLPPPITMPPARSSASAAKASATRPAGSRSQRAHSTYTKRGERKFKHRRRRTHGR